MKNFSFRVYVDESGDEGFTFRPDGTGSLRWLVLSALVIRPKNESSLISCLRDTRILLNRTPKQQLHFSDLKHEHRVPYVRRLADLPIRTITVLIHKPSILEPEKFQAEKFLLYRYACRYLLERVSWYCRDQRIQEEGDGTAEVIFSNRGAMSYHTVQSYLETLKSQSDPMDVRIDWNIINPTEVRAINHDQLAGLQAADAVASSLFYAANINRYGEFEFRYAELLRPTFYTHKKNALGYGLKFWPNDLEKLKSANPHLAGFAD